MGERFVFEISELVYLGIRHASRPTRGGRWGRNEVALFREAEEVTPLWFIVARCSFTVATRICAAAPRNCGRSISVKRRESYPCVRFYDVLRFRDGIVASPILEREWASSEAQTLGSAARWCHVHLRWYDRPAREKRLLEMGREYRLLVPVEEQTGTGPPPRPRCLQAPQLYADFWRGERWLGHERALEVSFR